MNVLGIETSADETSASIVQSGEKLLSNVIASSIDLQSRYGGIVPELAARSHLEALTPVINQAMHQAGASWNDVDAIAVTRGPGLSGSLLMGSLAARTIAIARRKPLYGVNHVLAHIYANFINQTSPALSKKYILPREKPAFPLLALVVSGGHTQLVLMKNHFDYKLLGKTADDAVGEAFDKVAKILGLPYPGGPSISAAALSGNPSAFKFPVAGRKTKAQQANKLHGDGATGGLGAYDFSFSGLKTAVLRAVQQACGQSYDFPSSRLAELLNQEQIADVAASFQATAVKTLVDATLDACKEFSPASLVIAGGVAANQELRKTLEVKSSIAPIYTDIKLCTDNAAMIASLGFYQTEAGQGPDDPYSLTIDPSLKM